jgi:hypothetical protein
MAWFRKTGQTWKLAIFVVACWVGLGLFFLRRVLHVRLPALAALGSAVLGLALFIWFFVSVRCPYCGGRPIWFMASRMKLRSFDPGGMEHCPICRDTGDVRPVDPPLFSSFRRM